MDELDTRIVDILQQDGRASNAGIAREVGVSEGTVRRRLKRLVHEEFISVVALPDPSKMGLATRALVGVQVDPDKVDQVADSISEFGEVKWVKITTGSYDIFAWVKLPTSEALGIFLRTKVGTVSGVRRTETFVNLDNKRRGAGAVQ